MTARSPLGPRYWLLLTALAWLAFGVCGVPAVHAEPGYTAQDTLSAIDEASAETGVSAAYLTAIVRCETGGSFSNYKVGAAGELGAVQLHPRGLLPVFLAWGYTDVYSPFQSVRFLAQEISFGRASQWSCA